MNNARRLLYNTILLTASAFIMRTVLVSFNVYLSNKIGAEGMGLFQLISAVYGMAITFSVAGIRLASMRLVADNLALGFNNQRQIMKRALAYAFFCGCFIGVLLFSFSGIISEKWIGNIAAKKSLELLSVSLPFVAASAALNGYFTSESKILRYTFVQLSEQIVKIAITVLCLKSAQKNLESSCTAVVFGISMGEIFSLSCSYTLYLFSSRKETENKTKGLFKGLMRIALPDALGSEMRSILTTTEHILIPRGLKKSGISAETAIATYGIIHGMSLPIVLYPSALLSSLSGLLVPEISSHYISGNKKRIDYMIHRVLHLTLLFSIGVAGILYFTADNLSEIFYSDKSAGFYIRVIAPLVPVMYCDMSVDGMLKGLDQQIQYMKYNIIDAFSCVVLVYFLVPVMSVKGYVFVIFFSEILNFFLSFRRLTIVADVEINLFRDIFIPVSSIFISCASIKFLLSIFSFNLGTKSLSAYIILISTILYIFMLRCFRAIDSEEIQWIKRLFYKKNPADI